MLTPSCLSSAGVLLLLGTSLCAQDSTHPTALPQPATHNRVVDLEWLRNSGAQLTGTLPHGRAGAAVAAAGDVNGDGLPDLLVGAPDGAGGRVYLVFGREAGFSHQAWPLDGSVPAGPGPDPWRGPALGGQAASAGTPAVTTLSSPAHEGAALGAAVTGLGDVNGDGYDDFALGAPGMNGPAGTASGMVAVVFGRAQWPEELIVTALDGHDGLLLHGAAPGDQLGASLAGPGDMNGDGLADLALGAPRAMVGEPGDSPDVMDDNGAPGTDQGGKLYLIFGRQRMAEGVDLGRLAPGQGVELMGQPGDRLGASLARVGDYDGDGIADLLAAAPQRTVGDRAQAGEAYLLFGDSQWPVSLESVSLGARAMVMKGGRAGDLLGSAMAGGSDLDGDGLPELILGAFGREDSSGDGRGLVTIVHGGTAPVAVVDLGLSDVLSTAGGSAGWAGVGGRPDQDLAGEAQAHGLRLTELRAPHSQAGLGTGLALGGDLNGDGRPDLVVLGQEGRAFVLRGGSDFSEWVDLGNLGAGGLELQAAGPAPLTAAFVGDLDGDGFDDLVVGQPNAGPLNQGRVTVLLGVANYALASGSIALGQDFRMSIHGTPQQGYLLLVSAEAFTRPLRTWRGDWWLAAQAFSAGVRSFDSKGQDLIDVTVPQNPVLAGITAYWQGVTMPQGFGQDLTGLMVTPVTQ